MALGVLQGTMRDKALDINPVYIPRQSCRDEEQQG